MSIASAAASGREDRAVTIVAGALVGGLVVALIGTVLDTVRLGDVIVPLHYKTFWRALPIVWLACQLHPAVRRALGFRRRPSDLPLALFVTAAALSVLLGGGRWGDVRHLVAAVGVLFVARALFETPERQRLLVHLLGGTVAVALARELITNPDLLPPQEMGRYALVTANANVLGFLFAMILPILLAEVLASQGVRRWLASGYAVAALFGVLLTFSRTAAAGAAIGAATLLLLVLPRRRGLLVLTAIALTFLAIQRPDQWVKLRTTGDAQRLRILKTSLSIVAEAPLLGVGFGINNLEKVFPDRYEARYGERVFRFHSMNQVVDLLVGTGIVGTALALWWAAGVSAAAIQRWRRAATRDRRIRAAGGLAALAAIALMSMAEPPLYHGKLVPLLFLVLASLELDETFDEAFGDDAAQDGGSTRSANGSRTSVRAPA